MPPSSTKLPPTSKECSNILLLGPFCGKPACQYIRVPSVVSPSEDQDTTGTGVCADAFAFRRTVLVEDVEKYPGHIACDGDTKSEIVVPLLNAQGECVGVLDLDCLAIAAFSEADKKGLEAIAALVGSGSDWAILST
jgi:L-methionine (R)-S-oxide reductase